MCGTGVENCFLHRSIYYICCIHFFLVLFIFIHIWPCATPLCLSGLIIFPLIVNCTACPFKKRTHWWRHRFDTDPSVQEKHTCFLLMISRASHWQLKTLHWLISLLLDTVLKPEESSNALQTGCSTLRSVRRSWSEKISGRFMYQSTGDAWDQDFPLFQHITPLSWTVAA